MLVWYIVYLDVYMNAGMTTSMYLGVCVHVGMGTCVYLGVYMHAGMYGIHVYLDVCVCWFGYICACWYGFMYIFRCTLLLVPECV